MLCMKHVKNVCMYVLCVCSNFGAFLDLCNFWLCIRSINNVLGFSRETLVAVIANIESREWRRIENIRSKRKPEHPRASSTDDVECFFSIMRDSIGKNFTTKQVKVGFRKACLEFTKRLDPDLPFFYHTSSHTRFYEGPLPDFSEAPKKQKKKRVPRREQPAAFAL